VVLRNLPERFIDFAYRAFTFCGLSFQNSSAIDEFCNSLKRVQSLRGRPYNPFRATPARYHTRKVWAVPRSLAATKGIAVAFFSSGYLDVSVPPVRLHTLWIQVWITGHDSGEVPPFGNPRINARLQLPGAYRSWPRPSSPPGAKASTICPY
jgi:hypothetical protein